MQELLELSQKNFRTLPSELRARRRRSRRTPRTSPYPSRTVSPARSRTSSLTSIHDPHLSLAQAVLRPRPANDMSPPRMPVFRAPTAEKPLEKAIDDARQRAVAGPRRGASPRKAKASEQKENFSIGPLMK